MSGANVVAVADGVQAALVRVQGELPRGVELKAVRDDSKWTRSSLEDVFAELVSHTDPERTAQSIADAVEQAAR